MTTEMGSPGLSWGSGVVVCITLPIFILPATVFLLLLRHQDTKLAKRKEERKRRYPPEPEVRPLPKSRPRRLTDVGCISQQPQSMFVTRLPVDIRLIIWDYVLGPEYNGQVIHLDFADGNLTHCRCIERNHQDIVGYRHACWYKTWVPHTIQISKGPFRRKNQRTEFSWRFEYAMFRQADRRELRRPEDDDLELIRWSGPRRLCAVPLTCKMLYDAFQSHRRKLPTLTHHFTDSYNEAIGTLYRSNTFDFRHTISILRLPKVIRPARFQQIGCLQLSVVFQKQGLNGGIIHAYKRLPSDLRQEDDTDKWIEACEVLATMHHLNKLRIALVLTYALACRRDGSNFWADSHMVYVLEPLKIVKAQQFDVSVNEVISDHARARLGETPFRILLDTRPRDKLEPVPGISRFRP